MAINLKTIINGSKSFVELMYFHTMQISRWEEVVLPDKTKKRVLVVKYTDVPCRISISQIQTDNPNTGKGVVKDVLWRPKVFCADTVDIIAADVIELNDGTKTYKGTASDVMMYDGHHKEFSLGIDQEA